MPQTAWHALPAPEVAALLATDPQRGLSPEEAAARLERYGRNELRREKPASPLKIFFSQFNNILTLILLAAIILSAAVGETLDAAIIAVIVLFCAILGFVQEYRSEKALEALRTMLAPKTRVIRAGRELETSGTELVPGDLVRLEAGDVVPADARVIEAHRLECDEAPLTGESAPVSKSPAPSPVAALAADQGSMLFAGATLTNGRGLGLVTTTGMDTQLGQIAGAVADIAAEPTPLEVRTREIGKWLGLGAAAICLLVAGVGLLREYLTGTVNLAFAANLAMFSISLAVAAVPEALSAIVTGALAIGMRKMAAENALIRRMPAVETLGCATVVCTDKTGTLTTGRMTVRELFTAGAVRSLDDEAFSPGDDAPARELLRAGLLCNDARPVEKDGARRILGDPVEAALLAAAEAAGLDRTALATQAPRLGEVPFSSERKRMSTLHADGRDFLVCCKGAPESLLELCDRVWDVSGVRALTGDDRQRILEANAAMADRAMRVLALAEKRLPAEAAPDPETPEADELESGLVFLGLAAMMDPPRPEAAKAVAACRRVGVRPVMLTGDHLATARAVAREVGIFREDDLVLTGPELEAMAPGELENVVERVSVYARVSPLHKPAIVAAWKSRGEVVAMTGDGVNDAPALKRADIGVAMGLSGTEAAREAADMILLDDNFATIVKAIELGRWIYDNIKKYLTYLLRCNLVEVAVIGGVVLAMGPDHLPLWPAAILYVNLATDGLPALALGAAPPDPDIMERKPRPPGESVFSPDVRLYLLAGLCLEVPLFLWIYLGAADDPLLARTRLFFLFLAVEIVIALNFRSMKYGVLTSPPHFWLVMACLWEIVLAAVLIQIPALREAFGVTFPHLPDLDLIGLACLAVFASMEGVKAWLRRTG